MLLTPDSVAQCARADPAALAVVGSANRLSYGALLARADSVAGLLLSNGVRPGDVVGICLERDPWLVATLLGVHRAGCAYLPLDLQYPQARLRFMLEDCAATAVLSAPGLLGPAAVGPVLVLDVCTAQRMEPSAVPLPRVSPGDVAYIIYTSGSTGTPKGVVVEHGGLANVFQSMSQILEVDSRSIVAALTTPTFDIAAIELLMPLTAGATIVIADAIRRDPSEVGDFLNSQQITIAQATPATWSALAGRGVDPRPTHKYP